jgi:hypothetical protein
MGVALATAVVLRRIVAALRPLLAICLVVVVVPAGARSASREIVYVASADDGPVYGYDALGSGSVGPIREVDNPQNPQTVWDPWGVAFDRAGNLYVQSFLSDATTFVFAPDPGPGAPPIRIFQVDGPDSRSVAVDPSGYEYVESGEGASEIAVARPRASGVPSNLYGVGAVRTFPTDETGFDPWPDVLSVDASANLRVATTRSDGNAVETYAGGAHGAASPISLLQGPETGLGACGFESCDQLATTFSPHTGRLYVAVSGGSTSAHVSVFTSGASGDAKPIRTIEGSATGLAGKVITGIADSQLTGDVYVMVKSAQFFAPGQIEVFGRYANGDVAPLRTFTDRRNSFVDAQGIALHTG